ncbi:MAG: hypothetical protein SGI91_24145 [Alphaproteobacteria bacterium]|jgi:hypothetical protein|nr:hypothetical protein [Alphaproteobacteria bacterium]
METLLDWKVLMLEPSELLPNLAAVALVAVGSYGLYWVTGIRSPLIPLAWSIGIILAVALHTGYLSVDLASNTPQSWGMVALSSFGLFLNFFAPNDVLAILVGTGGRVTHVGGKRPVLIRWVL